MDLVTLVRNHEGWNAFIYCDACGEVIRRLGVAGNTWRCAPGCRGGNLTIGHGCNLSNGITHDEGERLLNARLMTAVADLILFPWFVRLSGPRQDALIDMRYTMGAMRFRGFGKMIRALEAGDYTAAACEMLDSEWARNEAPNRAIEDADLLRSGQWPQDQATGGKG